MSPGCIAGVSWLSDGRHRIGGGIHHFCDAMAYRPLHRKVGLGA